MKVSKRFFFEKKKQKIFAKRGLLPGSRHDPSARKPFSPNTTVNFFDLCSDLQ
jgi:hypothetical protein